MNFTANKLLLFGATGDLSQDGSYESYQRLAKTLSGFRAPIYWLEGNHDKPAPMLRALRGQDNRVSPCVADIGNWTLVLLDSTIQFDVDHQSKLLLLLKQLKKTEHDQLSRPFLLEQYALGVVLDRH